MCRRACNNMARASESLLKWRARILNRYHKRDKKERKKKERRKRKKERGKKKEYTPGGITVITKRTMNHCRYTVSDTLHACARFQLREYNYWFSRRFVQDLFSRCIAFFRQFMPQGISFDLSLLSLPKKKKRKKMVSDKPDEKKEQRCTTYELKI